MKNKKLSLNLIAFLTLNLFLFACGEKSSNIKLSAKDSDNVALSKCLRLSSNKKFEEAVECLQIFKSRFPESGLAQEAEMRIGDSYFRQKEYLLAAESYKAFARINATNPKAAYALYKAGLCYEKEMPKGIDRDLSYIRDAKASYRETYTYYPNHQYAKAAQARYRRLEYKEAKKDYYVAKFYLKTGEYRAAIPRLQQIVKKYPDFRIHKDAFYNLVIAYDKLDHHEIAKEIAQDFIKRYPQTKLAKKLNSKILGGTNG